MGSLNTNPIRSRTHNALPLLKDTTVTTQSPQEMRPNTDYGQYFHFRAFVDILQKILWTMEPGVHIVQ